MIRSQHCLTMLLVLILLAACTSLSPHPTTDPTPTSTSVPTPALSLAGAHVFSLTQYAISDQSITNVRRVGIYEAWLGNRLLGTLAPVAQDILTLMVDGPSGERFLVGVVTRTSAMRLEIEASHPRRQTTISASIRAGGYFLAPLFFQDSRRRINYTQIEGITIR